MKITQLSIFIENKPGHVRAVCRTLADAGINIETMSLADTDQFGILRLIVKDWERAIAEFRKKGVFVKTTEVIAVLVENRPGGLADILDVLEEANINIEYMYGFQNKASDHSVLVFRFNDTDEAIEVLKKHNVTFLGNKELFG